MRKTFLGRPHCTSQLILKQIPNDNSPWKRGESSLSVEMTWMCRR